MNCFGSFIFITSFGYFFDTSSNFTWNLCHAKVNKNLKSAKENWEKLRKDYIIRLFDV
jgi:hypothetical protein